MLKVNKNVTEAMQLFNAMSVPRAEIVIDRIYSKPGANYKELFTQDEINKFNRSLHITELQLANLVNAFTFVLMHAIAERDFPQVEKVLLQSGLDADHHQIFTNAWHTYGNDYSLKVRETPIAVRDLLHSFNWNITLQIEESRLPLKNAANLMNVEGKIDKCDDLYSIDARNPAVNFIFETKQSGDDKNQDKFTIKVQKNQLQELFEQIETIQDNLDALM